MEWLGLVSEFLGRCKASDVPGVCCPKTLPGPTIELVISNVNNAYSVAFQLSATADRITNQIIGPDGLRITIRVWVRNTGANCDKSSKSNKFITLVSIVLKLNDT